MLHAASLMPSRKHRRASPIGPGEGCEVLVLHEPAAVAQPCLPESDRPVVDSRHDLPAFVEFGEQAPSSGDRKVTHGPMAAGQIAGVVVGGADLRERQAVVEPVHELPVAMVAADVAPKAAVMPHFGH